MHVCDMHQICTVYRKLTDKYNKLNPNNSCMIICHENVSGRHCLQKTNWQIDGVKHLNPKKHLIYLDVCVSYVIKPGCNTELQTSRIYVLHQQDIWELSSAVIAVAIRRKQGYASIPQQRRHLSNKNNYVLSNHILITWHNFWFLTCNKT